MNREITTAITKATTDSHGQGRYVPPSDKVLMLTNRSSNSGTAQTDLALSTLLAKT